MCVIVGHIWGGAGQSVILSAFGVHTFFVLSGYLITSLLQKERYGTGRINLSAFYSRRCFRIFPAAFAYIFIIALVSPRSRGALLSAVTYTVSYWPIRIPVYYQHLWSLSVEEQFYLIWPCLLLLFFHRRALIAWSAVALASLFRLTVVFSSAAYAPMFLHYSFLGTIDSVAAGCLLAIYEPVIRDRFQWMTDSPAIAIAIPLTAWVLESTLWQNLSVFWSLVPLLIAFWIFLLIQRKDWIFNNPIASWIGVLSYSLYLWQQPFLVDARGRLFLRLLMMAGCSITSYAVIEKPMQRLGAYLRGRQFAPPLQPQVEANVSD